MMTILVARCGLDPMRASRFLRVALNVIGSLEK